MQVITIGIDLAKHVFQVHGVDASDNFQQATAAITSAALLHQTRSVSHRHGSVCVGPLLGARVEELGHDIRLMPAKDVKAYVKRNKNDAVDAAACCEAVRRPTVRTVPIKTPEQQALLMQHRVRDLLV